MEVRLAPITLSLNEVDVVEVEENSMMNRALNKCGGDRVLCILMSFLFFEYVQ